MRFVPLIGTEGWPAERGGEPGAVRAPAVPPETVPSLPHAVAAAAEPFESIEDTGLEPLLERIGDARLVLLGEATPRHLRVLPLAGAADPRA